MTLFLRALLGACLSATVAMAGTVSIAATARGLTRSDDGGNYNTPTNYYSAGSFDGTVVRNHFDFDIPFGAWTSASLDLDQPASGHIGSSNTTFSVYSLTANSNAGPGTFLFSDLGAGTLYGSVNLSSSDNGTTVHIVLNAAALADILGAQGGTLRIAGVDSGESFNTLDFGNTGGANSLLVLSDVVASPEPGSIALMGLGVLGLALRFKKSLK